MNNNNNFNYFYNNKLLNNYNSLENNRSLDKKNKFDINLIKNKTFSSLNEVECFLNKITLAKKYIKIYNLFKK